MNMQNKSRYAVVVGMVCIAAVIAALMGIFGLVERLVDETENLPEVSRTSEPSGGQLYYNNTWYTPKESLETLLLLGIDKQLSGPADREDSEQADFLALLLIEPEEERFRILHL